MSYAYIQGQEEQALAYFTMLLEIERDPRERESLEKLVEKLRNELAKRTPFPQREGLVVQNVPSPCAFV